MTTLTQDEKLYAKMADKAYNYDKNMIEGAVVEIDSETSR